MKESCEAIRTLDFASWFFTLFVDILDADVFVIKYRNLKRSRGSADRACMGFTDFDNYTIVIDRWKGDASRILVHELCHLVLESLGDNFHDLITENRIVYLETLLWEAFNDRQKRVLRAFLPPGRRGACRKSKRRKQ